MARFTSGHAGYCTEYLACAITRVYRRHASPVGPDRSSQYTNAFACYLIEMERDLDNLIENPREDLNCELKEWLDLQQNAVRASIARHLAALANHGGGYLIFGFSDDLGHAPNRPDSLDSYSHDVFAGIVKHYLTPTFQCGVELVPHRNGQKFPVVRVPGHGRVPICAKAGGPQDDKGREQGIKKGIYYIRKPGPESAPVEGAEDWEPLIRRCVVNDRDRLLGDITALIQASEKPAPAAQQRLADWHRNGEKRFLQLLSQAQGVGWPVEFKDHRYQLSYLISADEDENLPTDSLCQILEEVNNEVRDTVWTGWSMFYPLSGTEFAPAIHPENPDGTGDDVLEANLISQSALPEFWRIALDGRATLVRAYREDRGNNVSASNQRAEHGFPLKRLCGRQRSLLPMRGCWRDDWKPRHESASGLLGSASKDENSRISIIESICPLDTSHGRTCA